VTSAGIGGGVSTFVGTSQACPVAAGVAALMLSAHPGLSPDALEAALKNTGVTVIDTRNGWSFRRIDAQSAVDAGRSPRSDGAPARWLAVRPPPACGWAAAG